MARYHVRELRSDECDAITAWHYEGRYATYDFDSGPPDPADGFFAIVDAADQLIGCCCYGVEARVPGVAADEAVIDVGYGMRPDLMGQGRGRQFIAAILAFGMQRFDAERFRVLVLDWNHRSLAACRSAGFTQTGEVTTGSGRFIALERPA